MSKYRFKTEKEFKRDSLWIKDHPNGWTSSGSMNQYLGQDIPDKYNRFCDANKDFSYETWSFSPNDYVLKEESFVLPFNWCIKVDRNCQPEEVYKWRNISWVDAGYICHDKDWKARVFSSDTEITLEQFKQHVLKESPVVETIVETPNQEEDYTGRTIKALVDHPEGTDVKKGEVIKIKEILDIVSCYTLEKTKAGTEGMVIIKPLNLSNWELVSEDDVDMKDIQEEAKKRFPIGCKFIPADSHKTHTLIEDYCTYEIHGKYIWAHNGHGHLYEDGKWATLVSLPETTKEMFYEGLVEGEIYIYDGTQISTYPEGPSMSIHGYTYTSNPKWTWCLPITRATEEQKALLRREIEKRDKKTVVKEWSEGTYAVGVKGNFGVFGSSNPISVGKIYTVKENITKDKIVTKESSYWVYKENLKWFATQKEALDFSKGFTKFNSPLWAANPIVEQKINTPSIKKETFIDNVQSVDVMLRTKRKSIKF